MHISILFSATVIASAHLAAAIAESADEQVWLLNCVDKGGARYSELALYPDFPNGFPTSTVILPTLYNTTISWEFANITEKFPGGTVFESSEFGLPSVAGATVGLTKLGLDDLTCNPYVVEALYTTTEDSVCSSVFQCARSQSTLDSNLSQAVHPLSTQKALPAKAALSAQGDGTKVIFKAYDHKVVTSGRLVAGDIFWNVWDERDAFFFSGRERNFGSDGCTVKYVGHGDIEWTTTNGLAATLLTAAQVKDFLQYTTYKKRECDTTCEDPRHPETPKCCSWKVNTYWQTHIPSRMDFEAINMPPANSGRNPSDQGTMSYYINCPAPANFIGCTICKILEDIFGGGSQIGGIGEASDAVKQVAKGFGVASLATTVACQLAGCS